MKSKKPIGQGTYHLTPKQRAALRRHWRCKLYDRNGTGEKKLVIKRVLVPEDRNGHPQLILLCAFSGKDKDGRFEFCVFTDGLHGKGHVPSDSFGHGTEEQGLDSLKEQVFGALTGIWPWVISEAWTKTHKILKAGN